MNRLVLVPALVLALAACSSSVLAASADHVEASAAWIRVLPGALPAGGYVTLANHADVPVTLVGADSPRYAGAMLHRSSRAGGMSRMQAVPTLAIPAHATLRLEPGGYHLMLEGARAPVTVGDSVRITLRFADGSTLPVDFATRPANALDAGADHPLGH